MKSHDDQIARDVKSKFKFGRPDRYSAKNASRLVPFSIFAPQAKSVYLTGDFNNWDESSMPMVRQPDGAWKLDVELTHGHHHYLFIVDGKPVLDPRAHGIARDESGQKVSVIAVS